MRNAIRPASARRADDGAQREREEVPSGARSDPMRGVIASSKDAELTLTSLTTMTDLELAPAGGACRGDGGRGNE